MPRGSHQPDPGVTGALAGRRALVTGAGSGIGRACARLLAREGAAVAMLDVRDDALDEAAAEVAAAGGRAIGLRCDVGSEPSVRDAVASAAGELGGLDTVVAAAGIARRGRTHELALEEWETVLRINLTGVFLTLKHTLAFLVDGGGGSVVTIGSVASLVAAGNAASYDASKGGVLQLTRLVAAEYVDSGIRANCVCPGIVDTPLGRNSRDLHGPLAPPVDAPSDRIRRPMERAADPEEIASVVVFLCSDGASFMTGAAVPVDGGYTAI
jgi:NAD(P)-dependent dehydrogenase (short-subunit alcohol dehydrogenase family)